MEIGRPYTTFDDRLSRPNWQFVGGVVRLVIFRRLRGLDVLLTQFYKSYFAIQNFVAAVPILGLYHHPNCTPSSSYSSANFLGGDILGEFDDQSFRTADIAEPIGVFEITDLADRVKAFVSQFVDDPVEVIDLDGDVSEA